MTRTRTLTLCGMICMLPLGMASAQGTMGPSKPQMPSPTQGIPGATSAAVSNAMDLPMTPPEGKFEPVEAPPPGDDPRDTPPPTIYGEEIDSENDTIIYVLDISCSMRRDRQSYVDADGNRTTGARIDRARAELSKSISGLAENFRFNVIAFDCAQRQWKGEVTPATEENKVAAIAWVGAQSPRGATGTGPATALALGDRENKAVALLTDGSPNCGARGRSGHRSMIANSNQQGATINVFGIAATGVYRAFCQGVASDNNGAYYDVP